MVFNRQQLWEFVRWSSPDRVKYVENLAARGDTGSIRSIYGGLATLYDEQGGGSGVSGLSGILDSIAGAIGDVVNGARSAVGTVFNAFSPSGGGGVVSVAPSVPAASAGINWTPIVLGGIGFIALLMLVRRR